MKTRVCLTAVLVILLGIMLVGAGCGSGGSTEDQGQGEAKPVLKVGMEATYAPFEYKDEDGNITGFDADLIRAIGEEMGYDVELSYVEWDGLDPALNSEQIDAVISAVTITEERKLEADFSEPYFEATQIIAVREDSPVQGLADLVGLKVGVQANTTGQYVCEDAEIPDENIVKYPTAPDAMMNLANGSLDAVVADAPVVLNYIVNNPEMPFKTVTDDFEKEYYGIKVKKGNTELLDKINEGLKKVKENGKFDEIHNKYFGE
ncbi:MAG: basic amino acid ABC transporter substrate-binding protein [Bacillota bacterium]